MVYYIIINYPVFEMTVLGLGSSLLVIIINQVLQIIQIAVKSDIKTGRI